MTIKQAKNELKKINERLQDNHNVEKVNKEMFSNAINDISEKDIDKIALKTALEEIIIKSKEIINSSKKEQTKLRQAIIQTKYQIPEFDPDAQK